MTNNIRFKIIAGKINKIPEFRTIFARKMLDYIIRQRDRGQAEAKCLRPRPKFWPRGHFGLEDVTSLLLIDKFNSCPKSVTNNWEYPVNFKA